MTKSKILNSQLVILLVISSLLTAFVPSNETPVLQNLVFVAKADAYVSAANPASNYGTLTSLRVDASPLQKTYLRFRVSGLNGRPIKSARLAIYANSASTAGLVVRATSSNLWQETTINFNNAPAGKNPVLASIKTVTAKKWMIFNLSAYVKSEGVFSFVVNTPGVTGISLAARELAGASPRLILTVDNPASGDPVLVGAGDIASCGSSGDEATANLIDKIPGTVFTTGDNAYSSGSAQEYANCYDPSWGRFKARTRPSPGNHEYRTSGASGYFGYFGAAAGEPGKGYYSYNLGNWHIVVLNSEIDVAAGSAQEKWLRQDLAQNPRVCTLAYWHQPLFSSGAAHGNDPAYKPIWQALYDFRADVVVNGHDHTYERFAPQDPNGVANAKGIREFVAGMGGSSHYSFGNIEPNSQVRNSDTYGVLKFTLHATSYSWEFIPVAGKTFTDSGTTQCTP